MSGQDPWQLLNSEDPVEVMVMVSIARRWFAMKADLDRSLAHEIINTLGKSMKG
jgi:hypothetical protein